jgi:hypothetical protein
MIHRQFKPDLTGSDESLEHLLARLRSFSKLRPLHPRGRDLPPDFGSLVTSRRPPGGAGGAEAPIPVERPIADLYAPT